MNFGTPADSSARLATERDLECAPGERETPEASLCIRCQEAVERRPA